LFDGFPSFNQIAMKITRNEIGKIIVSPRTLHFTETIIGNDADSKNFSQHRSSCPGFLLRTRGYSAQAFRD
jgi:hypothetical protein